MAMGRNATIARSGRLVCGSTISKTPDRPSRIPIIRRRLKRSNPSAIAMGKAISGMVAMMIDMMPDGSRATET